MAPTRRVDRPGWGEPRSIWGRRLAVTCALLLFLATPSAGATAPQLQLSTVTNSLTVANVVPTWGAQIPKIVFDGSWYYAAVLDTPPEERYPWRGRIFRSRDGVSWEQAIELRDTSNHSTYVCTTCGATQPSQGAQYQPVALLLNSRNELVLQMECWNGAECYPGIASPPGDHTLVYTMRLIFSERLADGSIDFSQYVDRSIREQPLDGPPSSRERYYAGMAMDPTRRYLYTAFSGYGNQPVTNSTNSAGYVWFNVFDTESRSDVFTTLVADPPGPAAAPPCGRAWLYFRVRPGAAPGEIFLFFEQVVLCQSLVNSAPIDAAWVWRSVDGGRTFPERHRIVDVPYADGYTSWVDSSDAAVDQNGVLHLIYYKVQNGFSTLYYQRGVNGVPQPVGSLDNHSQIVIRPNGERLVLSTPAQNYVTPSPSPGTFVVARSTDGVTWRQEEYPVAGVAAVYWPNLLSPLAGNSPSAVGDTIGFLLSASRAEDQGPREDVYSTVFYGRYSPDSGGGGVPTADRVVICHATGSSSRPYVQIVASKAGSAHGHLGNSHQNGGDIIPPFQSGGQTYSQNWPTGQPVWANGCNA